MASNTLTLALALALAGCGKPEAKANVPPKVTDDQQTIHALELKIENLKASNEMRLALISGWEALDKANRTTIRELKANLERVEKRCGEGAARR